MIVPIDTAKVAARLNPKLFGPAFGMSLGVFGLMIIAGMVYGEPIFIEGVADDQNEVTEMED